MNSLVISVIYFKTDLDLLINLSAHTKCNQKNTTNISFLYRPHLFYSYLLSIVFYIYEKLAKTKVSCYYLY